MLHVNRLRKLSERFIRPVVPVVAALALLGENVPIANGTTSDALLALNPDSGEWVRLRVPYPLGFFSRGLDGRIDDPDAGWKGRGVWADFGTNIPWHLEGGQGTTSKIVKFQIRPDPLAY